MEVKVKHDVENGQFLAELEGHIAEVVYKVRDNKIYYLHTWVPEELGGKGIAKAMVEVALKYAEDNDFEVVPLCPFVRAYLERNKDWQSRLRIRKLRVV